MKSCYQKVVCPICGHVISKPNFNRHLEAHKNGHTIKESCSHTECQFCGKTFGTTIGCGLHERYCHSNPAHAIPISHKAWNKGKTKADDDRIAKYAATASKSKKGCYNHLQSDETKQKISIARKKYLDEHPDKVPFKLNHSSKESYPEKYFRKWLTKNNLLEKQELQVSRYTLDFAWETNKVYLEVDGGQHKLDWMQEHDKIRTNFLTGFGWTCIARIDWPEYQKLNRYQKHSYLQKLKTKILSMI